MLKYLAIHKMGKYVMNAYFYVIVLNFYVIMNTQLKNTTIFPVIFFFLGENV